MVMDWLVATGIQVLVDGPGILTGYGPQIPDFVTVAGGTEESKIMPISSRVYVLGYPEHLFPVVWHEKMSVHAVTSVKKGRKRKVSNISNTVGPRFRGPRFRDTPI
eukprot:sb/3477846/